jgi:hypothetical protein
MPFIVRPYIVYADHRLCRSSFMPIIVYADHRLCRSSFMPFIPAGADHAPQAKALIQQHPSLALRALVGFFFSNENLNLFGQKAAD